MTDIERDDITQLMQTIADHVRAGNQHVEGALEQYRQAGVGLMDLREIIEPGRWIATLNEIGIDASFATRCIRLAAYWEQIPADIKVGYITATGRRRAPSFTRAHQSLRGLPEVNHRGVAQSDDASNCRNLALQMRRDGMSVREIAATIGRPFATVEGWLNPASSKKSQERYNQKRRDQALLDKVRRREERDRLAKDTPNKALSRAYSNVRKICVDLEEALAAANPTERGFITTAYTRATTCEASIVNALKASRQHQ